MSAVASTEQQPRVVELKGAGRHYLCQDGQLRPSVTTILGAINKPALVAWAANQERALVTEAAATLYGETFGQPKLDRHAFITALTTALGMTKAHTRALDKAAEIGTQTHKHIEWVLRKDLGQVVGPTPPLSPKALLAYQAFDAWRDGVRLIPQRIEQQIWSRAHNYAGTLDLLASITLASGRHTAVLDFKTGKAIYAEALLQVTAYSFALAEMGHLPGPVHGVVVRLPKVESDPGVGIKIITPEEQGMLFTVFLAVKQLWDWLQVQERERQEARTRPAPTSTMIEGNGAAQPAIPAVAGAGEGAAPESSIAPVLAQLAEAKAALARQPSDEQWATIVLGYCGVTDPTKAERGSLLRLVADVKGMAKKDPHAIKRVRAILTDPANAKPPASAAPTTTEGDASETRQEAWAHNPTLPGAGSTSESTTSPSAAAMLVDEGDPREKLLGAIAAAKGQLERQPPEDVWTTILIATCGTADLMTADPQRLEALLELVRQLVAKDQAAIDRVAAIMKGRKQ